MTIPDGMATPSAMREAIEQLLWYHVVDVVPGVTTPGWFDLRHALDLIPFPDVRGKRCLDIGTWDGFYAWELERRGAAEVVAIDLPSLVAIDWTPEALADPGFDPSQEGLQRRPAGFELIKELTGSKVTWRGESIYDLDADTIGAFDLVVCGSLLVHLRDPVRALDAVRRVTRGWFLSIDYVHAPLNLLNLVARGRPIFELRGKSRDFQWWLASDAGFRHLLDVAGFQVERASDPFLLRPGQPERPSGARPRLQQALNWVLTRDPTPGGHLHRAYLTTPRF